MRARIVFSGVLLGISTAFLAAPVALAAPTTPPATVTAENDEPMADVVETEDEIPPDGTQQQATPAQPGTTDYTVVALGGAGVVAAGGAGFLLFRRARRRA